MTVKLLRWISHVRIRVSDVARAAVSYVRWKERYPDRPVPSLSRWLSFVNLVARGLGILSSLIWTIAVHPSIYWPWPYRAKEPLKARRRRMGPRREDLPGKGNIAQLPNCVNVALNGLRLAARRDSQLEFWQTNYQSELALASN